MKPKNPTRDKLEESIYFFEELKENYQDDQKFNWALNAFLTSFRSITNYMQNQYCNCDDFNEWYLESLAAMKDDNELSFMKNSRDVTVHEESKDIGATRQVEVKFMFALAGPDKTTTHIMKKLDNDNLDKTAKWYFLEFKEVDILIFASKQIEKMKNLVDDCEDKFLL